MWDTACCCAKAGRSNDEASASPTFFGEVVREGFSYRKELAIGEIIACGIKVRLASWGDTLVQATNSQPSSRSLHPI